MDEALVARHSSPAERFDRARPEAISGAQPRRPIVMILGNQRSGTSLCSHILSTLGVDMADNIWADVGNEEGHWERLELVNFHNRILDVFNRTYSSELHDLPMPAAWWADPEVVTIRREMIAFLEQRMGQGNFGFKDPRTVRLMPLWHQICDELKLAPKIVLCLRDPAQVARSLHARDGLDRAVGEYRWLVHMIDFFRYTGGLEYCLIEYETWFDNPGANFQRLRKFLGLQWHQSEIDLDLMLANLIKPKLRHDDHETANLALARSLYSLVRQTNQDMDAREGIDEIVSQFIAVQQMLVPLQRAFENAHAAAEKLPEYEQQLAASRALIVERDAAIESARVNVESAAIALEYAEADAACLRELVEFEHEQHVTELARAEDETATLRATLVESEKRRIEGSAKLRLAMDDIAILRQTIDSDAATAKALDAEAVALREQVAAARQVGRELLAALQVSAATKSPPPQRVVKPSWWRSPFFRSPAAIHTT